jgi:hypothetical protein
MGEDYIQRLTLLAIITGGSSNIVSNFLIAVLNSHGLLNRGDILLLIIALWIVFFLTYTFITRCVSVVDAKKPRWIIYLRRIGNITNVVLALFVSIYLNNIIGAINFQSLSLSEVILTMVGAIMFLAAFQIVLEMFIFTDDPRSDLSRHTEHARPV